MDENLYIQMNDFLNHYILEYNFNREDLIRIIKFSDKYYYDSINDMIKNKYKLRKRIIIIRDIPKDEQNKEFISNYYFQCCENIIKKIENCNEIFLIYFENEEKAEEAFAILEQNKQKNVK